MHETAKTLLNAKKKCDEIGFDCIVYETYYDRSCWKPADETLVPHGKEVYRNY